MGGVKIGVDGPHRQPHGPPPCAGEEVCGEVGKNLTPNPFPLEGRGRAARVVAGAAFTPTHGPPKRSEWGISGGRGFGR